MSSLLTDCHIKTSMCLRSDKKELLDNKWTSNGYGERAFAKSGPHCGMPHHSTSITARVWQLSKQPLKLNITKFTEWKVYEDTLKLYYEHFSESPVFLYCVLYCIVMYCTVLENGGRYCFGFCRHIHRRFALYLGCYKTSCAIYAKTHCENNMLKCF